MQITKDNLTIVIVTIKSEKIIDNCLNSIDPAIKKIIVENSSNHKFTNDIQNRYENIECYITGENLGMGQGNNFGIKKVKTRYVMILNPDTILKKDTLSKIFQISENLNFSILSPQSDNKEYPNYKILNNRSITAIHEIIKYTYIPTPQQFHQPLNITQQQVLFLIIILNNDMIAICLPHSRVLRDTPYKGPQTGILDVSLNPCTIRTFNIFL